ncbi:DUF2631 domain-containing protein [Aldersonia sp. NBC_00410]|uniref:DUF2631 domain-containing protein n=1 Tax=Aldersonia sp. NBC_00410 TaxID=2975954 RepID=UPI00224FEDD5|nr:DUF2631 domain-containing protein [Aldersonia sp. NBC_00410]MCX5046222.1 DUF2631 domain-containing protein [Aldersonia sp. NBC_00410]
MAGTELDPAHYDPVVVANVDTAEVPSAAWGWSGESRKTFRVAGWTVAVILVLMNIGNHHGHVEDIFLIGFAAIIVGILLRDSYLSRHPR